MWLESPGTMLCRTLDIERHRRARTRARHPTCIDNSWATPLFQKPIQLGVDLVVHSASKYIGGHSDVMAGAVIDRSASSMLQIFYRAYMLNGGILAPFDALAAAARAAHAAAAHAPASRGGCCGREFLRARMTPCAASSIRRSRRRRSALAASAGGHSPASSASADTADFDDGVRA
jgi:hypothetical protein